VIRRLLRSRAGWLAATAALSAMALVGTAIAQSASGLDLSWHTFGGGGNASSSDGKYQLRSVSGQTFTAVSSNGPYQVDSGYLGGGQAPKTKRFVPVAKDD
jgi:hypothetical protein